MTEKSVFTVTVAEQDRVAVCGEVPKVTLGSTVHVRPEGVGSTERLTVPLNPLRPVTVMVWVIALPLTPLTVTGEDGAIEKSVSWNRIDPVACVRDPLVPVTVTV